MIYLDNNATTKIDPRVLDSMMPFLTTEYGNAASNHEFGVSINQYVKEARARLAQLLGSEANEIIFTSGATEGINLALKGVAESYSEKGKHIVTVSTEHPAVLDTCKYLESKGFEITYLPVLPSGLLDLVEVEKSIRQDTLLVSVMLVNNETGVIQPIKQISEIAHSKGAFVMTDATQAVGKMPLDVDVLGIDILCFSGHKFHAPKGIGGLFVRGRKPNRVKLNAILHGGGHERGFRSGTLNVPGIVGLAKAAQIAKDELSRDQDMVGKLRDYLESELLKIGDAIINGNTKHRLHNVSNICFKGADADAIMAGLKNIMVSNGSACTSTKVEPSHVLKAMELTDEDAYSSIRFSLGRFNTKDDITEAIKSLKKVIKNLRSMRIEATI